MTTSGSSHIRIFGDNSELTKAAAEEVTRQAVSAIQSQERFSLALAGGSTPKGLYALLAGPEIRETIPWAKVQVFWGDERHVPPDHQDSNYRMAQETLLSKVPIPETQVHRIHGELADPEEAARQYETVLYDVFHIRPPTVPRFDLILLGMGPDGHTASLFPGTSVVHESSRLVAAPWVEKFQTYRITLTPPVLAHAAQVMFFVSGEEKAESLKAVREGLLDPDRFPAQVLRSAQGRVLWLVDQSAASQLS